MLKYVPYVSQVLLLEGLGLLGVLKEERRQLLLCLVERESPEFSLFHGGTS